jgi:hypothetical protein
MSVFTSVAEEFKRSPVTVLATVAGVALTAGSLLLAWLQYAHPSTAPTAPVQPGQGPGINIANLLLVLSYFLAATFTVASLLRFLARYHGFAAFILSIPAAVLSSFSSLVVLSFAPPRPLTAEAFATAKDSALYGTVAIFVAIGGLAVIRDFLSPVRPPVSTPAVASGSKESKGGEIGVVLILLLVWSTLVSNGLSKLVISFIDIPMAK